LNWYLLAVIAAIGYAAQMLGLQRLQRTYAIPVYMAYIWIGAGSLIGILFIKPGQVLTLQHGLLLVAAAVGSWIGMYAINAAIKRQPNLGYTDAVSSLRLGLMYGVSLWLFDAGFEPLKLVFIVGAATGAMMVIGLQKGDAGQRSPVWVVWTLASVLFFVLMFVSTRVVANTGLDVRMATAIIMWMAGLMYIGQSVHGGANLRPGKDGRWIILTIACSTLGNAAYFSSIATAPNLAYADAIVNLRMVLLYLTALLIGADRLQPVKAAGVVLAFGCAVLLGLT
jgi:drug/metabolite transporter (DMT)-like permease